MRIGIIGGGASGLVAAISAKINNNEVVILERNKECGKKILATGNGRCNYWNEDQNLNHYESSNKELISAIINDETEEEVMNLFNSIGIIPKIKNGYYYPSSNQAITIRDALVNECIDKGVIIKTNYYVESLKKKNNKFIINNDEEFDKVIVATGSYASPKTGSDGNGFELIKSHKIIKPLPALVQLITKKEKYLNTWKGIRCDVRVNLFDGSRVLASQSGEIQLTDYGISGICVFNLSNKVGRKLNNKEKIFIGIDFLPNMSHEELLDYVIKDKPIKRVLDLLLNNKLVDAILEYLNIDKNKKFVELTKEQKGKLLDTIKFFTVEVIGTKTFDEAQTTSGGISLEDIDPTYFESRKIKGLFIVGELLDITGECGGYNLGIAWRSGVVAGLTAGGAFDD